ncbi:hypothetical protein [Dyadobacter sediminis]|nr:hypothetical protein [Dyadobacter sediminis]
MKAHEVIGRYINRKVAERTTKTRTPIGQAENRLSLSELSDKQSRLLK